MFLVLILFLQFVLGQGRFDYIVVGGGTGGGTLAVELAKRGYATLLMEAGPDAYNPNSSVPLFHTRASEDPEITFDYSVKHNEGGREYFYPRAGVLGGCSTHNAMLAVYPNTKDFDIMKRITQDDTWDERSMREHFKVMEKAMYRDNMLPKHLAKNTTLEISRILGIPEATLLSLMPPQFDPVDHGVDGWYTTSHIHFLKQLVQDEALSELLDAVVGDPRVDINGYTSDGKLCSDQEGTVFVPQSIDPTSYTRADFPNYIKRASQAYPLTIWTDSFVTKVIFNNKAAIGVEYVQGQYLYQASPNYRPDAHKNLKRKRILANKEIILSAGAFNTPQILMLSGIGDRTHLESHNINIVSEVWGVGRNLMDRYEIPVVIEYPKPFQLAQGCTFSPTLSDPCYRAYLNQKGPYSSNGIISGQLKKSSPNLSEPDIFLINILSDFHGYFRGYSKNFQDRSDCFTRLILKSRTHNQFGQVSLISPDPFRTPEINFHSFEDGDPDLEILVDAIKHERRSLQSLNSPHTELYPGPDVQTDDEIREYIRTLAWGHHACCTARIGSKVDPKSVLDPQFKVRGVTNLRVVDASAFPEIPGYFPTLYLHMFAMKAAEVITRDVGNDFAKPSSFSTDHLPINSNQY